MSMSKKLTFSLASLVLIIGLVFAIAPAMAQEENTPIQTGTITADGFGVIAAPDTFASTTDVNDAADITGDLPDLDEQLLSGVTIVLAAPINKDRAGVTLAQDADPLVVSNIKLKDVVISEIMWGLNANAATFAEQADEQYIELYNTVLAADAASVSVMDWQLFFFSDHSTAAGGYLEALNDDGMLEVDLNEPADGIDEDGSETFTVVDIVSNISKGGYTFDIGQSGALRVTDGITPKNIISAYRNINYTNIQKADHDKDTDVDNEKARLGAVPNGEDKGSWKASTRGFDLFEIGSPGKRHFPGAVSIVSSSTVPYAPFVINEISVNTNTDYNWIEILNKTEAEASLNNYNLSKVTGFDKDDSLINFKDKDIKIPGKGVLLIVATDPKKDDDHPLAVGVNAETEEGANSNDLLKSGLTSRYIVRDGVKSLPSGEILLILRNAHNQTGKSGNNFIDVTGSLKVEDDRSDFVTDLWPLKKTGAPHADVIDGNLKDFKAGTVYRRANAGIGWGEHTWAVAAHTGLGYKRGRTGNGTPGYDNGAAAEFAGKATKADGTANADYVAAPVTISEIMYAAGSGLPQWVELYNSSMTQGVKLNDWQLKLENDADVPMRTSVIVKLADKIIPPNQVVLIVASSGRNSGREEFPNSRILEIWTDGLKDKSKLEIIDGTSRRAFNFLSQTAFKITLMNKDGEMVDTVGNMGADPAWDLPMAEEGRSSIIRRYDEGVARDGTMIGDGTAGSAGWVLASDSPLAQTQRDTYYGSGEDQGTPGFRAGGALPVSLSKFRPERLDNGAVVIRWITESELNNAGFNILRSETRNGEFTKLNTNLIAGQGTISERTVYEYADTSAKPNVVYYYQIQDVSLDGKVQTLRTNRLKGDISADGKLTTTWGELKLQD